MKSFFERSYRQTTSAQCCWCYNIRIPWWISVHEGLSILTDSSWPVFSPMIVNSYWFTKFTLRPLIAILYRAATVHVNLSKLLAPQMHVTSDISFLFPPNPSLWLFILDACRVYAERVKNPSVCVCVCKSKCVAKNQPVFKHTIYAWKPNVFDLPDPQPPKNEKASCLKIDTELEPLSARQTTKARLLDTGHETVLREQTEDVARRNDANGCLGEWYWVLDVPSNDHWDFVRRRS